ncbi:hypothetical protein KBH77_00220 [Patescibacteria group bacterium]|nr:hypothetical protein [Patescibacteria group bacterium]
MIDLKSGNFYLIKHLSDDKTDIMNVTIVKNNFVFFTLLSDNIYQRMSIDDFNNKFKLIDNE